MGTWHFKHLRHLKTFKTWITFFKLYKRLIFYTLYFPPQPLKSKDLSYSHHILSFVHKPLFLSLSGKPSFSACAIPWSFIFTPAAGNTVCPIKCKMCVCVAISFTNATRVSLSTVFALHLTYPKPNDPFHKPLIINGVEVKCIPCLSAAKQQPVTEVIVGSYSREFITRPAPSPRILHYPLDLPRNLCCHSVFVRVPTITLIKCLGSRVAPVLLTPAAQKIHLARSLSPHTNTANRTPPIWRTGPEGLHVWGCFFLVQSGRK